MERVSRFSIESFYQWGTRDADGPKTDAGLILPGEDPENNVVDNLAAGLRYYLRLIDHYGIAENQAAAAYNKGPTKYKTNENAQQYQKSFDTHVEAFNALISCWNTGVPYRNEH